LHFSEGSLCHDSSNHLRKSIHLVYNNLQDSTSPVNLPLMHNNSLEFRPSPFLASRLCHLVSLTCLVSMASLHNFQLNNLNNNVHQHSNNHRGSTPMNLPIPHNFHQACTLHLASWRLDRHQGFQAQWEIIPAIGLVDGKCQEHSKAL
jgi:hypothetical protein